ncbi:MAG: SDR family oxidoreductase [Rhodocyclaceae bacterium]|jgi:NAD(P)-dependent dehydrogenase (short-subunit alcohol dehydrogenase family)|nr:SDR family oxidoreductase [Rhodocyclaceae bacterium]
MEIPKLFSLEGRTAMVTGASSGIGLHLAGVLAQAGAAVALVARRRDRLQAAAEALAAQGHRVCTAYLDVTDAASIPAAFDSAEAQLGAPVDTLLNNSGILYAKRFLDQDMTEVERLLDTNLKGAFRVAQEAARRMVKHGGGNIINVASTAGLAAGAQFSSYCASKAGLIQLTKVMALELAGKNIRVNVVCPGNVETDMLQTFKDKGMDKAVVERIPLRRLGRPDDLDGVVLLLASDAGRYMTGTAIPVDGGQLLSWM